VKGDPTTDGFPGACLMALEVYLDIVLMIGGPMWRCAGNSGSSVASYPAPCPGAVGVAATDSTEVGGLVELR